MTVPYLSIVVVSVCAIVFYRAGQLERSWPLLWAALSIAASCVALALIHRGVGGVLVAQVAVFLGITVYRMVK